MAERGAPQLYSIAAHRGFADALVAGLIPRYAEAELGLARLTLLLPSARAQRIVTEAFVRLSGGGMLLPRMARVGDLDLDETLGPLLDPLGAGSAVPPAADPTRRWLRLAELLRAELGERAPQLPGLLRLAHETGRTMDRLAIEGIALGDLLQDRVAGIVGDLAGHWREAARLYAVVQARWLSELAARGEVDAPGAERHEPLPAEVAPVATAPAARRVRARLTYQHYGNRGAVEADEVLDGSDRQEQRADHVGIRARLQFNVIRDGTRERDQRGREYGGVVEQRGKQGALGGALGLNAEDVLGR